MSAILTRHCVHGNARPINPMRCRVSVPYGFNHPAIDVIGNEPAHYEIPGLIGRGVSDANKLRQVIEMFVTCVEGQIVLQDHCRKPHAIRWNRSALLAKLPKQ
jgi:hypothetical protein